MLVAQLEKALVDHFPQDPDVFETADHLADLLGKGYPEETACVES